MAIAKPPIVSAAEWAEAQKSADPAGGGRRGGAGDLDRRPQTHADGARRAELFVRGPDGKLSLADLFEGRKQLILYRFFFEEGVDGWPDAGCSGCSSWVDGVADLNLLHARDITFAMASPAPQSNLRAYAERMGWTDIPWYTIRSESFTEDFDATEWFALNMFLRDGDDIYRTYCLKHGPMVSQIGSVASLFSLTPYGEPGRRRRGPGRVAAGGILVLAPAA